MVFRLLLLVVRWLSLNRNKSGFTLVELAIVLVIVGLLLGGILKGQELINSARVRNLADQSSSVQAAYYGFIDRFKKKPGDWGVTAASQAMGVAVTLGGDDNSVVDNNFIEAAAVWDQLSKANFLVGGFTPATAAVTTTDQYVAHSPKSAFNGNLVLSRNQGYTGLRAPRLNLHTGPNVPVRIARELDLKVDDGRPNTGIVRLSRVDGTSTDFDGANNIFRDSASVCTTIMTATTPAATAGNSIAETDIYDIYDDSQDCGVVFIY